MPWRALTVVLCCSASVAAHADTFLLKNVQRIDVAKRFIAHTDVWVQDGHIAAVPKTLPAGAEVVDAQGKWLLPGLTDLHVHTSGNSLPNGQFWDMGPHAAGRATLYAGVSAMLDCAGDPNELFEARAQQRSGDPNTDDEADLYAAGMPFGNWNLPDANSAAGIVQDYVKARHPDVVKFIYDTKTLAGPAFLAAMRGLQGTPVTTVVHIGTWQHALDAINAGATVVTHLHDEEVIPQEVVRAWGRSKTASVPTMAVQLELANFVDNPKLLDNPMLKDMIPPWALRALHTPKEFSTAGDFTNGWQHDDRQNDRITLHLMVGAGVHILAGSDTANFGTLQGFSLHRELILLRSSGLGAWETLAAATADAAALLKRPSGIELGDVAEFVLLNADPVEDTASTQDLALIVHHGKRVDRAALKKRVRADWPPTP